LGIPTVFIDIQIKYWWETEIVNPLNAKLNPICHLLALLGAHHILHVSRIRVKFHLMVFGGKV